MRGAHIGALIKIVSVGEREIAVTRLIVCLGTWITGWDFVSSWIHVFGETNIFVGTFVKILQFLDGGFVFFEVDESFGVAIKEPTDFNSQELSIL